jgi:hypothetical protein
MGDEFYAIIKLVSGEEVFSQVCIDENEGDPVVVLSSPVIMKSVQNLNGILIKVKPWIDLSDDDFFIIKLDKIITMTETKNKNLIRLYENYINDEDVDIFNSSDSGSGKVNLSNRMGYISSVKEAREVLEKIFKHL